MSCILCYYKNLYCIIRQFSLICDFGRFPKHWFLNIRGSESALQHNLLTLTSYSLKCCTKLCLMRCQRSWDHCRQYLAA